MGIDMEMKQGGCEGNSSDGLNLESSATGFNNHFTLIARVRGI